MPEPAVKTIKWMAIGVPSAFPEIGAPTIGDVMTLTAELADEIVAAGLAVESAEVPKGGYEGGFGAAHIAKKAGKAEPTSDPGGGQGDNKDKAAPNKRGRE